MTRQDNPTHTAGTGSAPPSRTTFVGRLEELAEMRRAVEALPAGGGSLFLLTGEPGIGKTRLGEELGASAAGTGVRVLWGRCHEAEGRPPYWPWAQVVQACAPIFDPARLAESLTPDALPLAELVPELRPHLEHALPLAPAADPEAARFRLFQALASLLRRVAAAQPLLLVLDDLHWADLPSLRMLEFLAHELRELPIVVVGTFREVEVRRSVAVADIIDRLARRGRRLSLAGFTVEEVSRFVEGTAGQRVPEAMAQRLRRETEGNPFFLDEIARQFRGAGWWLPSSSGLPVSQGVHGAIRQRLAPLPEATRALLAAAAVVGREFELPLVEAATGTPRALLLEQLAPAVDIEILSPIQDRPGRYRFSHALVRETLYEQLAPVEKVALHRRFGTILEDRHRSSLDEHLPELAYHFFAAAAGGEEAKALHYAELAGRHARRILAYEEAAEQFQRALHLGELGGFGEPERECELLLALAEAKIRAGQGGESSQACHRAAAIARRIGSSALLARAAIGLCDVGVAWAEIGRSDDTLVHTLEEALEQLDPGETVLRARVMARLATELFWTRPLDEIDDLSRRAVELARRAGDAPTLAYALMARIHCVSGPDAFEDRRGFIDEVIALSQGRGELAINAYLWRFGDEMQFGDRTSSQAAGEKLIRAVQDLRQPRDLWLVPAVRSREAVMLGRFEEAERYAEQVVEHSLGVPNAEQSYLGLLFMIRREQGRHGEMIHGLAAIAGQSIVAVWRASLTLLYAENGEVDKALAEMDALTRDDLRAIRRDLIWLFSVASLAAACNACGDRRQAERLYRALLPYDGHTVVEGVFCYFGPVSYYLGILATVRGDHEAATRHLEAAWTAANAVGARPFLARILLAKAEATEARGGSGAAASALALREQAAALAASMGMEGVATAAGQRPRGGGLAVEAVPLRAQLHCEGDFWVVGYKGRTSRLKAIKGFIHLARLLESPRREFHVLEMTSAAELVESSASRGMADNDLGPLLDARAKAELRRRVEELRAELAEAERDNDDFRAAAARGEMEAISEQVAGALGLHGRDRTIGSQAERARAAVTKALRAAIERIGQGDPALAEILARTVRTGVFCSYVPLAEMELAWDVRAVPPGREG